MTGQETTVNSWDGLLKNYLKADALKEDHEVFVCVGVEVKGEEMNLELERKDESFTFGLNITNMVFLKNNGIIIPKEAVGKKLTLSKVKVFNPAKKQEVDGLRITRVE